MPSIYSTTGGYDDSDEFENSFDDPVPNRKAEGRVMSHSANKQEKLTLISSDYLIGNKLRNSYKLSMLPEYCCLRLLNMQKLKNQIIRLIIAEADNCPDDESVESVAELAAYEHYDIVQCEISGKYDGAAVELIIDYKTSVLTVSAAEMKYINQIKEYMEQE